MKWNVVTGKWKQLEGEVKTRWAKLTDDDITHAAGQRDRLVGKIQERYGLLKADAEKQVDEWVTRLNDKLDEVGRSHETHHHH
jgi:uncharacterized protein YjbJ (UPF0337 family)